MWVWMVIALNVVTNVHGYASRPFPEACETMLPQHGPNEPGKDEPPFETDYELGEEGEPIRVTLRSNKPTTFMGFMLEAREQGHADDGPPVGRFILLDDENTQLLNCPGSPGSALIQKYNHQKSEIKANWTSDGAKLNIVFRTTFLQTYSMFWEPVDKKVTLPPPTPTTTASTSEPTTTTASTSEPTTTTASTSEPTTTTASTSEPTTTTASISEPTTTTTSISEPTTTTASTSEPTTTTASTSEPTTTTTSTSEPNSTSGTAKSVTTASTTNPSTTARHTTQPQLEPSVSTSSPVSVISVTDLQPSKDVMAAAMTTMTFDSLSVVLGMELCNILNSITSLHHGLNKGIKITCALFCAAAEISALVLCCVGDFNKAVLVPLVVTTMVINFIKLIIESLPLGSKLRSEADVAAKVCSVIHELLTIAVMFVAVWETDHCRKNPNESWLVTVMAVYTAWLFLFMVWVFVLHQIELCRKVNPRVNPEKQFPRKKKLCTADKAFSVVLIVGTVAFNVAIIYGIFGCPKKPDA